MSLVILEATRKWLSGKDKVAEMLQDLQRGRTKAGNEGGSDGGIKRVRNGQRSSDQKNEHSMR